MNVFLGRCLGLIGVLQLRFLYFSSMSGAQSASQSGSWRVAITIEAACFPGCLVVSKCCTAPKRRLPTTSELPRYLPKSLRWSVCCLAAYKWAAAREVTAGERPQMCDVTHLLLEEGDALEPSALKFWGLSQHGHELGIAWSNCWFQEVNAILGCGYLEISCCPVQIDLRSPFRGRNSRTRRPIHRPL